MKIVLDLKSDSANTYCDNVEFSIESFNDGGSREDLIFININDREIAIDKKVFKTVVSIL